MDVLTKQQRHKNMSHIRSKDTKAELLLRKALWHVGVRYRKNWKLLPGKPDIAITKSHIAIFVDGDFWHGRDLKHTEQRIETNNKFWSEKLERNIQRDQFVDDQLTALGWLVLRFWASDVQKHTQDCVDKIFEYLPLKRK